MVLTNFFAAERLAAQPHLSVIEIWWCIARKRVVSECMSVLQTVYITDKVHVIVTYITSMRRALVSLANTQPTHQTARRSVYYLAIHTETTLEHRNTLEMVRYLLKS